MNEITNFEVHFFIDKDTQRYAMRICYNNGTKERQFIVKDRTSIFMVIDMFLSWIDEFERKFK